MLSYIKGRVRANNEGYREPFTKSRATQRKLTRVLEAACALQQLGSLALPVHGLAIRVRVLQLHLPPLT